jgi:hypothetical protein
MALDFIRKLLAKAGLRGQSPKKIVRPSKNPEHFFIKTDADEKEEVPCAPIRFTVSRWQADDAIIPLESKDVVVAKDGKRKIIGGCGC